MQTPTFYAKYGDWIVWFSFTGLVILLAWVLKRRKSNVI
jgi:apolipoprotein N-acyltransferase